MTTILRSAVILIATERTTDAALVRRALADDFDNVEVSTNAELFVVPTGGPLLPHRPPSITRGSNDSRGSRTETQTKSARDAFVNGLITGRRIG